VGLLTWSRKSLKTFSGVVELVLVSLVCAVVDPLASFPLAYAHEPLKPAASEKERTIEATDGCLRNSEERRLILIGRLC
jgi:hypothetical protein